MAVAWRVNRIDPAEIRTRQPGTGAHPDPADEGSIDPHEGLEPMRDLLV